MAWLLCVFGVLLFFYIYFWRNIIPPRKPLKGCDMLPINGDGSEMNLNERKLFKWSGKASHSTNPTKLEDILREVKDL